mgnify:CR=1 FL=1
MADAVRDPATDADIAAGITAARASAPPPTDSDEWRARSRLEREVLAGLRRCDFRAGRERIVVVRWNGVMAIVLPTEQA